MNSDSAGRLCGACGQDNRLQARFCRHCGVALAELGLDAIVGREDLKVKLSAIINKVRLGRQRQLRGLPGLAINLHTLFMGSTGSGKTLVARLLARNLFALGLLKTDAVREINLEQIERYNGSASALLQAEAARLGGGLIIIDEIHRNTRLIGEIVNFMENQGPQSPGGAVFVLTGLQEILEPYFKNQNDDLQRFGLIHHFIDYQAADLGAIATAYLRQHAFVFDADVERRLADFAAACLSANDSPYRNGWLVEREIVPRILNAQSDRLANMDPAALDDAALTRLLPADIPSSGLPAADRDTVLRELDNLVGLDGVKAEIRRLADTVLIGGERSAVLASLGQAAGPAGLQTPVHLVLRGNPGTGKTTIARMLGRLFRAIGVLPSDRVLEVDRGKLVAQFVGQTAPLVHKVCDQARGGILFIDEAYTLTQDSGKGQRDTFGQEALDTLLKRMEDDRGSYVVIAAGYPDEMERFVNANPGLRSRFTTFLDLPDYDVDQLAAIFRKMASGNGFLLNEAADARMVAVMQALYAGRTARFANARAVRTLFEDAIKDQSRRLARLPASERQAVVLRSFMADDIDAEEKLLPHPPVTELVS